MDTATFEAARRNMVEYQIRCCKVLDADILDMIEALPREDYLPEAVRTLAYMEGHVPLPCDQEMLSPLQEASILQKLQLKGDERILEIGAGTGFLTTMLALRGGEVVSCEIHKELAELAAKNLEGHGITNAEVIHVNAMDEEALNSAVSGKFDVIVVGAALEELPEHLRGLLQENGQIMAFIGKNPVLSLIHFNYQGDVCVKDSLFETLLQNMEGMPHKREFVF